MKAQRLVGINTEKNDASLLRVRAIEKERKKEI